MDERRNAPNKRILILGVPRSGKSRLAARLAAAHAMTHYPIDSLVSALGDAFPQTGVGRQFDEAASTVALAPLLLKWVPHLDYEGADYILEGYNVSVATAATLAALGFRVAALGYASVDPDRMCREIRATEHAGEWTTELTDAQLHNLVVRLKQESAQLRVRSRKSGLTYFDVGADMETTLDAAFEFLSRNL